MNNSKQSKVQHQKIHEVQAELEQIQNIKKEVIEQKEKIRKVYTHQKQDRQQEEIIHKLYTQQKQNVQIEVQSELEKKQNRQKEITRKRKSNERNEGVQSELERIQNRQKEIIEKRNNNSKTDKKDKTIKKTKNNDKIIKTKNNNLDDSSNSDDEAAEIEEPISLEEGDSVKDSLTFVLDTNIEQRIYNDASKVLNQDLLNCMACNRLWSHQRASVFKYQELNVANMNKLFQPKRTFHPIRDEMYTISKFKGLVLSKYGVSNDGYVLCTECQTNIGNCKDSKYFCVNRQIGEFPFQDATHYERQLIAPIQSTIYVKTYKGNLMLT